MLKRAVLCAALLTGCAVAADAQPTTAPTQPNPTQPATTTTTTTTMPTTTTTAAPVNLTDVAYYLARLDVEAAGRCVELFDIARAAGWPPELMVDILDEAWQESRCMNLTGPVHGQPAHPKWNGWDWGPLQINKVWHDDIANHFGDWRVVADPFYNFAWAWEMYKWHEHHKGCGFRPWTRRCR